MFLFSTFSKKPKSTSTSLFSCSTPSFTAKHSRSERKGVAYQLLIFRRNWTFHAFYISFPDDAPKLISSRHITVLITNYMFFGGWNLFTFWILGHVRRALQLSLFLSASLSPVLLIYIFQCNPIRIKYIEPIEQLFMSGFLFYLDVLDMEMWRNIENRWKAMPNFISQFVKCEKKFWTTTTTFDYVNKCEIFSYSSNFRRNREVKENSGVHKSFFTWSISVSVK